MSVRHRSAIVAGVNVAYRERKPGQPGPSAPARIPDPCHWPGTDLEAGPERQRGAGNESPPSGRRWGR